MECTERDSVLLSVYLFFLAKILQTFTWVDAEWLITGKGEMIKQKTTTKTENSPSLAELIQYLREKDLKIERLIEEKTELKVKFEMAKISNPGLFLLCTTIPLIV